MVDLLEQLELLRSVEGRTKVLSGRSGAFWIDDAGFAEEEATLDIDSLLNRRSQKREAQ